MKKIYTLALATAVALSASAERRAAADRLPFNEAFANGVVKENLLNVKAHRAPAKAAATTADFEALDTWSYAGLLNGQGEGMTDALKVTVSGTEATVVLRGDIELKATVDAAAGTLSLPNKQYLLDDSDGPVYFYIKGVDSEGKLLNGASDVAASVGTYADGKVTFPEMDVWAVGDPANENLGWYALTAMNSFAKDTWVVLGDGEFVQNLVYDAFTGKEDKTSTTVTVKTDGNGNYKVVDPLGNLYSALDINAISPELVLYATDPDNVWFGMTSTGINGGSKDGIYYYFSEKWYFDNYAEEGDVFDPALAITKKVEGETVTITFPVNCAVLLANGSGQMYYTANQVSTLTFTDPNAGISNIAIDNTNAPVEYFNLQGVRVANPENGLYIRRQGNTVAKVLVK